MKYSQRQNAGHVMCVLNEGAIPAVWKGGGVVNSIAYYDSECAVKGPYKYMFQKVSEKALGTLPRPLHGLCYH